MTEHEAWSHLERCFRDKSELKPFERVALTGICSGIEVLCMEQSIEAEVACAMVAKIRSVWPECTTYFWPLDRDGARQRAALCRAMAEQCEQPGAGAEPVT